MDYRGYKVPIDAFDTPEDIYQVDPNIPEFEKESALRNAVNVYDEWVEWNETRARWDRQPVQID